MKKILAIVLSLMLLAAFAACGETGENPSENNPQTPSDPATPVDPPEITVPNGNYLLALAEDVLSLIEGDAGIEIGIATFTRDGADADHAYLSYASSNPDVVAIEEGKINAIGGGTATVTVSCKNASDTLTVNVLGVANGDEILTEKGVKTYGRVYENSDGLVIDNVNSGVEFAFYGTEFKMKIYNSCGTVQYIRYYLDGDEEGTRVPIGLPMERTYTFASGLEEGEHTIRILKATEQRYGNTTYSFTVMQVFTGENCRILERATETDDVLKIDFYGDSITAGQGNLSVNSSDAITVGNSDGTQTYAAFAAQELGSEGSFVGYGGITVKAPHFYGSEITMYSIWHWYSTLNRVDYPVDPDTDFVVINLGTNDSNVSNYSTEQFTADYLSLLNEMKNSYPNAHFVLCYGMMGRAYGIDSGITAVVEQFDGEASYCKLPSNLEGAGSHPTVDGHRAAGRYLAQFIEGLL